MGLNLGILASSKAASGGGTDADAQAFFDRVTAAGGTLSATEKTAVNTLTLSLKSTGIWNKMRVIYPMVGSSAAACSQNLKSASFTGTFGGSWAYASTGVTPQSGATLDVPLNLNTMNSINDISFGYYCRTNTSAVSSFGWYLAGNPNVQFFIRYTDNNRYGYIFDSNNSGGATTDSRGLNSISRILSTEKMMQKNGVISTYTASSSGSLFSKNFSFTNGSQGQEFQRENAFGFIGNGLTSTELGNLYTAVQAFQTTLTRQI